MPFYSQNRPWITRTFTDSIFFAETLEEQLKDSRYLKVAVCLASDRGDNLPACSSLISDSQAYLSFTAPQFEVE